MVYTRMYNMINVYTWYIHVCTYWGIVYTILYTVQSIQIYVYTDFTWITTGFHGKHCDKEQSAFTAPEIFLMVGQTQKRQKRPSASLCLAWRARRHLVLKVCIPCLACCLFQLPCMYNAFLALVQFPYCWWVDVTLRTFKSLAWHVRHTENVARLMGPDLKWSVVVNKVHCSMYTVCT